MRRRFASLTSRLVLTAVALVAVVAVLIGAATALAMRSYLTSRLDAEVSQAVRRAAFIDGPGGPGGPGGGPLVVDRDDDSDTDVGYDLRQQSGTLVAELDGDSPSGIVLTEEAGAARPLSDAALAALAQLPSDGEVRGVVLPSFGTYRVAATEGADGVVRVNGLPTTDVDDAVASLVRVELLLALLGVLASAAAGTVVVRRQLRPLTEVAATAHTVAAMQLSSGDIDLSERVPDHLTDAGTEVGQVGAALNTLLAHVETSLTARHRSEQQVRQFVGDASHELRTPLATIAGYTELARRRPDDPALARMALDKVEEESERMTSLVEDLLLLARLDAGRPLDRNPVDLTHLLVEAVSDARVLGPEHQWRLELAETLEESPESSIVVGDEQRLHQVVTNLLTNARKYTPAGSTVTVSVVPHGFRVHDDGPGFAPDVLAHAFERFARGDIARHREGGVGLGLALVRAIVTSHGGTVDLTSVPGDTALEVRLPPG